MPLMNMFLFCFVYGVPFRKSRVHSNHVIFFSPFLNFCSDNLILELVSLFPYCLDVVSSQWEVMCAAVTGVCMEAERKACV